MGLRINTNVLSLNAQRNLNSTSRALGKALQRLSSGSRINRAGDDAAGLAISEGLQSQVRGLNVAVRNANDAVGFLNTAEGALAEITNISQRLRELAIQAANGTLSVTDRGYLEDEKTALIAEFDRIATQTQFNGVALLDGSFQETDLQVGVNKGETISFTIGDARASSLGALASRSGNQGMLQGGFTGAGAVSINGISIAATSSADDSVSVANNSVSAIAVAKRINDKQSQTGVKAEIQDTIVEFEGTRWSMYGGTLPAFEINNVSISGTGITSAQKFVDAVNDFSNATGVKARLNDSDATTIELYAEDGRNIQLEFTTLSVAWTNAQTALDNLQAVLFGASANFGTLSADDEKLFSVDVTFIGSMNALVLSGGAITIIRSGSVKLISSSDITVTGTSIDDNIGFAQGSYAVVTTTAINTIDLTTASGASNALATVDATLSQVTALRASLGAVQNRLESTASNISITLENISAARSQIRDADIAAETAELTRAQILQQAGVAVLGQANAASQIALSLLRF